MSNIGIALQLCSSSEPESGALPSLLGAFRASGFQFVQWTGLSALSAGDLRAALDTAGLKTIAGACPAEAFDEDHEGAVRALRTLGAPDIASYLQCGPEAGPDAWLAAAARFGRLGARLREDGLRLSCLHRAIELEPVSGHNETPLDILLRTTGPDDVCVQWDTGWIAASGASPGDHIRARAGRCPIVHVKDLAVPVTSGARPVFTVPGQGVLDWDDVFDAVEEAAVEWLVFEPDACGAGSIEAARAAYAFLAEHA